MNIVERKLGLYERYHVARSNAGKAFQPTIVLSASLAWTPGEFDVRERGLQAIAALLSRHPMLACVIADHQTRDPKYSRVVVHPADVFLVTETGPSPDDRLSVIQDASLANISDPRWKLDEAPLWRVDWYRTPKSKEGALIMTMHHVLCDGRGALVLFQELLSLISSPPPSVDAKQIELPPSMDSTISLKPSILYLLGVLFNEFVRPHIPKILLPTPLPSWPPSSSTPSFKCRPTGKMLFFPQATVDHVKKVGKSHGIKTLQPVIMACGIQSLHQVITASPEAFHPKRLELETETARSLRDPSLGHPSTTGNYVAPHAYSFVVDASSTPSEESLWEAAKTYAASLSDPSALATDKGKMGMLAYIPDPPPAAGSSITGWEKWLLKRAHSEKPFRALLEISNLGVGPGPPIPGLRVDGLWFAQNPGPLTAALVMNVVSYPGTGMGIWVNWREGVLDGKTGLDFIQTFAQTFNQIGETNVDK